MATTTISALTAVTGANLTGAAVLPVDDANVNTRKSSLQQARTAILAGGTGMTASDPLVAGAATLGATTTTTLAASGALTVSSGGAAITGNSSVAGNLPVTGDVGVNAAANATSATSPFLWAPSTAGTPTGVPAASMGGALPVVIDSTNSKLYVRIGGTWKGVDMGAAAAANGFVLISTATASNSAALIFTGLASSSYSSYQVVFDGIWPASTAYLLLECSTDGGSTYGSLLTHSTFYGSDATAWGSGLAGTASQFAYMSRTVNTANNFGVSGIMAMHYGASSGDRPQFHWNTTFYDGATNVGTAIGSAMYNSATEVNAIKLMMSTGNITRGTARLYGLQKA
jgi:hypothetical protein